MEDLSFAVRPGVVTGFPGPNGAGKSTTMRMLSAIDDGPVILLAVGEHADAGGRRRLLDVLS